MQLHNTERYYIIVMTITNDIANGFLNIKLQVSFWKTALSKITDSYPGVSGYAILNDNKPLQGTSFGTQLFRECVLFFNYFEILLKGQELHTIHPRQLNKNMTKIINIS